jgi:hypothetical protein
VAENPFLLPLGSPPPSSPPPTPPLAVPAAPVPVRDPDRYIAIPPSVESATHRLAHAATGEVAAETAPALRVDTVAEETQLAAPVNPVTPVHLILILPDGSRVPVASPLLLGRDPAAPSDRPGALLVSLSDTGKTVSKTHALIEPDDRAGTGEFTVRVRDLYSTNGVAITTGGERRVLTAGGEDVAQLGSLIELGSVSILVSRS